MSADSADGGCRPRCYGLQVLIAGRRKCWRDRVSAQVRRAGYVATTVDSAVDALTVLVLGLPVDVLVSDTDVLDELDGPHLAVEARALRPEIGLVFADDAIDGGPAIPEEARNGPFASTIRRALSASA